jgi:hypothetical protein
VTHCTLATRLDEHRLDPAIAGNPVVIYGIVDNWGTGYGFAGNWVAGYSVAGVPVVGDALHATGSSFTSGILVNTSMCYILSQINVRILYILVKKPNRMQIVQ